MSCKVKNADISSQLCVADWIGIWLDVSASIQTHSFTLKRNSRFLRKVGRFNEYTAQKPNEHNLINNGREKLRNKIYIA
jgi:hypothetical protein